jgi:hypothetical protein
MAIRLFISSSPDLAAERKALGQAVAELPVSVGFKVRHTRSDENTNIDETLASIEQCDLHVIVLGADFAAPMGLEWQRAQSALRPTLAYAKRELHSLSAQHLLRESGNVWIQFESPQELRAKATRALVQALLDRGETLGLHVEDIDRLLAAPGTEDQAPSGELDQREGAGRSGIILGHRE